MGELNVSFQIETDNRENFPSLAAFGAFRKQRDLFYEILRIWEENHLIPGWVFQIALGGKIRTLLTMYNDVTNHCHFARLFKSQLLISCIRSKQQEDENDDESMSFLKTFKNINPEKLTQLKKRFVTPLPSKTDGRGPSFPGIQEFFKDFILHAFNPMFYEHLENCLVHEIMELDDTQFVNSDIEDSETMVDEQTNQNFMTCISSLRLLAKVLGLLVSLPYRSECGISKEIMASHIEIRSKVCPSLNLRLCLSNAIRKEKLILTIPWIIKYLAMLDVVSLHLPYFKQILETLYYIYWVLNHCDYSKSELPMTQESALFLKSLLNWLFLLPTFPKDLSMIWEYNLKSEKEQTLQQFKKQCIHYLEKNDIPTESVDMEGPTKHSLDKLDIIDETVLRTCCLPTIKKRCPLMSGNGKVNNNSSRHIKPVSSKLEPSSNANIRHLEFQLEEAFFHGQPASTRKTVDFVSERVASTCVKHICNTLLVSLREANLNAFRKVMKGKQGVQYLENGKNLSPNETAHFKSLLTSDMNQLAAKYSKDVKDQCEKDVLHICEARVEKSIDSLLAEDSLPSVKDMCVKVATRMAMERINHWIQSHIIGGSLFIKDMELEVNAFLKNNSPVQVRTQTGHNEDAASPTDVIVGLRSIIWDLLDTGGKSLTLTSILDVIKRLDQTLNERADLSVGPEKILYFMSVDLTLFLLTYRPDLFTEGVQQKLIGLWKLKRLEESESDLPMGRWLSPRNIMLLAQPQDNDVWLRYGMFLRTLLKNDVLSIEILGDQCVALFRQEWPVPILKHLSKCLTEAIADYKASDEDAEKVKYLLGWVAETYHEIEFCDDLDFTN